MQAKALDSGAGEIVFDLEDAVAVDGKAAAREQIADTLGRPEWSDRAVAVRVNAGRLRPTSPATSRCAARSGSRR